ncbi:MAG: FliI/YscN family ATPase [bacterium]|nr:FliI/YscN family ATPase [bacterium]
MSLPWAETIKKVRRTDSVRGNGTVSGIKGLSVEILGLTAAVGTVCSIDVGRAAVPVLAEVVGFRDGCAVAMPYRTMDGVAPGQKAVVVANALTVPADERLLGRILDGLGTPIDGGPALAHLRERTVRADPPRALTRMRITEPMTTGVRSIDGLVTMAKGQRLGIFAGSGVGKSVLLGMLARNAEADVIVCALIGERGREVREFLERDLGPDGLARSVVVVVTSDENAVLRIKGAETALTIAEAFRDKGRNVLFLMDSVTRYAMALREIGLAAGEPPTTKGYTPSVYAMLPKLCERTGCSAEAAITAFFTVLIEGDDIHDPIGDAVRSILDGHIMLSRDLAREGHYPAVDVLGSISRLRNEVVAPEVRAAGTKLMRWLKALEDNRDLINIGAYVAGSDPLVDTALAKREPVRRFLCQEVAESSSWSDTVSSLMALTNGA